MEEGTSWLITGGTGSFGNAFVRRLLAAPDGGRGALKGLPRPKRVVVFSRDELKQAEMAGKVVDERVRYLIGSVVDSERVEVAMRGIDYVVHAAAMKRIDTCELNPSEAVATNVEGTRVVASQAIWAGVKRGVFLSTDKASAPNTHYGATKLAAERLWIRSNVYAAGTGTRLAATRYGNVLGSRGSVVNIFKAQAKAKKALKITDPGMTRFWMTLDQAVDLVLLAFREMRGGEVFVPKIGSCRIDQLARAVAGDTFDTEFIGIRRGEKLHEMLISEDEMRDTVDHDGYYTIEPDRTWENGTQPFRKRIRPIPGGYRSDTNPHQLSVEDLRSML